MHILYVCIGNKPLTKDHMNKNTIPEAQKSDVKKPDPVATRIRAKMECSKIEPIGNQELVQLSAVTSGSEENKSFAIATPSASVAITIENPAAKGVFISGREYYVDFTLVPV